MDVVLSDTFTFSDSKVLEFWGEYETSFVDLPALIYGMHPQAYDSMMYGIFDSVALAIPLSGFSVSDTMTLSDTLAIVGYILVISQSDIISISDIALQTLTIILGPNDSIENWYDFTEGDWAILHLSKGDLMTILDSNSTMATNALSIGIGDGMTFGDSTGDRSGTTETTYIRRYLNDILGRV